VTLPQATEPQRSGGYPGLLEKLMGAVRPEFRVEVYTVDPRDPILGGPACRIGDCERTARLRGMCPTHYDRWTKLGCPDIDEFVSTTPAKMRGYRPLESCLVPGCHYGRRGAGLCPRHHTHWLSEGKPPVQDWVATQPEITLTDGTLCQVRYCALWAQGATALCLSHAHRWRQAGRPPLADFATAFDEIVPGHERLLFGRLPTHLRLEMQYAAQHRRDDLRVRTPPQHIQHLITAVARSGVHSLLDWSEDQWLTYSPLARATPTQARSLVIYARRLVENLHYGHGWDVEYPRDTWRMRNLGISGHYAHVRFGRIPQPWLKDLAKRWARWQLSTGTSISHVVECVAAVDRFATFLAQPGKRVDRAGQITRRVLERYLAELQTSIGDNLRRRGRIISITSTFLRAIRLHHWAELPTDAVLYSEDFPKRPEPLPRALPDHVMAQIENPDNLACWDDPAARLVTIILIRCGLRIGDALALPRECVVRDADNAPYLRYFNHKMKREALVPIDEQVEAEISGQQRRVLSRWPAGSCPHLFPGLKSNANGQRHLAETTYRVMLKRWLARCDIRDEHGQPAHVQPHQWRHTLGTRLINNDVPQEVVRRILDHDSHEMTGHYARMHDTTIRRHWEAARKVNARGETVTLDPAGSLSDAAWAKQRLSRATQALPNGYCGLPVVQTCPHANACLTCPMFITTSAFLPQHRQQHQEVLQIISAAQARGQTRLAEMNQQVAGNLEKIITSLEADASGQPDGAADAS
jgi:integrase